MSKSFILKPVITEKSVSQTAQNRFTFAVTPSASKSQIKKLVEETFQVEVVSVRTTKSSGKRRRVGKLRREVRKSDRKKAVVQLKTGQKIDLFESKA